MAEDETKVEDVVDEEELEDEDEDVVDEDTEE